MDKKKNKKSRYPRTETPVNKKKIDLEVNLQNTKKTSSITMKILYEEIHPNDTVTSFYDRVQNSAFDEWKVDPNCKFFLIIQLKTKSHNSQQLKIISESIPSNYNIPLISSPLIISIDSQELPPIKISELIDDGFYKTEIDPITAFKMIRNGKHNMYEMQKLFFKREDDPADERLHSYILNTLRYKLCDAEDLKFAFSQEFNDLIKKKYILSKKLDDKNVFSVNFEDLLFYEHVMMNSFIKCNEDKTSAFLLSLLIFQIIRSGDELINDYYSDIFIENFDEYSDMVTVIKTIFPLLKYDKNGPFDGYLNDKEKYIEKGFNADKCDSIISYLFFNFKIYYNLINKKNDDIDGDDDDDDEEIYTEYCKSIDKLQIFIFDLSTKIDDFIKNLKNEKILTLHQYTFQHMENGQFIFVQTTGKKKMYVRLNNRPGWHGYSMPENIFAFCVTINEVEKTNIISMIHSTGKQMGINSIPIPEELDNIFIQAMLNSILPVDNFRPLFLPKNGKKEKIYVLTNTIKGNKSYISYYPKPLNDNNNEDENKAKTELIDSINLVKVFNPFLPRSLLIPDKNLKLIIELQSSGLSNIHSRVYDCTSLVEKSKKKKKKSKNDVNKDIDTEPKPDPKSDPEIAKEFDLNSPFYNLPFAYQITKESLAFLWNNIDDLKGFLPSIRIAWNASEFTNFGHNKIQNEEPISQPEIFSDMKSIFEHPSSLFILSDKKIPQLGKEIPLGTFQEFSKDNIYQMISQFLPESCKVSSDSFMFIVQIPGSSIEVKTSTEDMKLRPLDKNRRKMLEKVLQSHSESFFEGPSSNKLAIQLTDFLRILESEISNIEQFPENISFESVSFGSELKKFNSDDLQNQFMVEFNFSDDSLITISYVGNYCFFLKITKMIGKSDESDVQKESRIISTIRKVAKDLLGIDVDVSSHYDLFTFSFPVLKYQGINVDERLKKINKQIVSRAYPFMFHLPDIYEEGNNRSFIKFDVFSEKVSIELAKLIGNQFKDEILNKPFEIPYPHPIMKDHKQTMENVENWILSNNDKLHKDGHEWVGPVPDVEKLEKQFKTDIENKVFQFDHRPFNLSIKKYKQMKKQFEKEGFLDYQYSKLYEILIIRPEDFSQFNHDIEINNQLKFCNRVCKGSYPVSKRLPLYDIESDSWSTIYFTFCEYCLLNSISERTSEYFTSSDVMNDASKIIRKLKDDDQIRIETKWRPFDLLLQKKDELKIGKNFSVPIGQFIYYLVEQTSQKLTPFVKAWISMAADVAVRQCQMITSCPDHINQIVKLSKSPNDILKCGFGGVCENYFHMKCLRWHNLTVDDSKSKKNCQNKPIDYYHKFCPNCNVPSLNLFNNMIVSCDRCGCVWCYLCETPIEHEKIMKHLREFHDGNFNL